MNFRIDTKLELLELELYLTKINTLNTYTLLLVLSDFSKTQRYNLKMLAQRFEIAIHFHPGHPKLKTLTNSLDTLI